MDLCASPSGGDLPAIHAEYWHVVAEFPCGSEAAVGGEYPIQGMPKCAFLGEPLKYSSGSYYPCAEVA